MGNSCIDAEADEPHLYCHEAVAEAFTCCAYAICPLPTGNFAAHSAQSFDVEILTLGGTEI